jgi:uncharacterized protein
MLALARQLRGDVSLLDSRAVFALVYTAIGLTCIAYFKDPKYLQGLLSWTRFEQIGTQAVSPTDNNLAALIWWAGVSMVFYFVIPALWLLSRGMSLREFGLNGNIEGGAARLVGSCMLIMLPLVYLMSLTSGFAAKYPFLQIYNGTPYIGGSFMVWELAYFLQFFGLEFFFRGFVLHSLKTSIGMYSIFVMTVPYTMIHFQKPMAEAFAAIAAGVFLGWLSYRNGNIWLGLILHCFVALSMDIMALYNKGLLFA